MAKIEMDVTEYDSLRKNIELAEKRSNELKEAKEEISKLQQEKIDALKAAEKQVIYRRESYSEEIVRPTRSRYEILRALESRFRRVGSFSGRERFGLGIGEYSSSYDPYGTSDLADMFFTKDVVRSSPVVESVTTKGLDEVKAELRTQLEAELSEEIKTRLARLEEIEPQVRKLEKENSKLERKITTTGDYYTNVSNELVNLKEKVLIDKKLQNARAAATTDIRDLLDNKVGSWFKARKQIKDFSKVIKELDEEITKIYNE